VFLGWYSLSVKENSSSSTFTETYTFLPGTNYRTTDSCTGSFCHLLGSMANGSNSSSYSHGPAGADLSHVATLYGALLYVLVAGGALGLVASIVGFASRGRKQRWVTPVMALAIVAILLAIAAPALVTADNVAALKADTTRASGAGPWSSFYGRNSTANVTESWGPSYGYYLGIVGAAILLVGGIVWGRARRAEPMPAGATQSSMPGSASSEDQLPAGPTPPPGAP
jgi:hypothetical protein